MLKRATVMQTIQVTIDEHLLKEVDTIVSMLQTDRSAFICEALHGAVQRYHLRKLEPQHAAGYARHPMDVGEFDQSVVVLPDPGLPSTTNRRCSWTAERRSSTGSRSISRWRPYPSLASL